MRASWPVFIGTLVLLSVSRLFADTITIPEPPNANQTDGINLAINNYTWDAMVAILICDPFVTCDSNSREFSDVIQLVNQGGKALVLFGSDSDEERLRTLQLPNDVFDNEGPFNSKISHAFDAHDNTGRAATLTVIYSSDPDTPSVTESDTIEILAGTGSPAPDISIIPEPVLTLPIGGALLVLAVLGLSKRSPFHFSNVR